LKARYNLGKNYAQWVIDGKAKLKFDANRIVPISYRPLDTRWTYFDNKLLWRWRENVMKHMFRVDNFNLMMTRQTKDEVGAFIGTSIAAHKAFSAYDITYNFPLYPHGGTAQQCYPPRAGPPARSGSSPPRYTACGSPGGCL